MVKDRSDGQLLAARDMGSIAPWAAGRSNRAWFPSTAQMTENGESALTKGLFDTVLTGGGAFAGKAWFFKDGEYIRVNVADMTVEQARKPIVGNWGQDGTWPETYANGIDAVLRGTGAFAGKCWFFKDNAYIRYDLVEDRAETPPRPIVGNWGQCNTWPAAYANGIDAVFPGTGAFAGKCWFFRGDSYIRYDLASNTAETPPQPIVGNWAGAHWPKTLVGGIDAVVGAPAGNTFVLRGGMAIEYNPAVNSIIDGPFWIEDRWPEIVDAFYPSDVRWGVDSLNAANHRLGAQTLYEYVTTKCGMQPRFWGRYLDLLTPIETAYLLDRGVAILLIFRNVTATLVSGDRANGRQAGQQAVDLATNLAVPPKTALFVGIEPDWHPSKAFLLGWWDKLEPSLFFDGIYCNPHHASGFSSVYPSAFDARTSEVPPMTAQTFLWSQYPRVPSNTEFSRCPTGREARSIDFRPEFVCRSDGSRVNEAGLNLWQCKVNWLPSRQHDINGPVARVAGNVDSNLARAAALDRMW
jgi:hypothetical protein